MAVFRVAKNKNYTVMSNYHLKEQNLSLKSKGLLSMILSLPDSWNYTTRGLSAICKEGVDCIGSTLRELESAGYLERNTLRDAQGRITDTEYVIYEFPQEKSNSDTSPPYTENPYMDKSDTKKPAQYIINKKNKDGGNKEIKNIHQSIPALKEIGEIDNFEKHREIIKENIDYDLLISKQNQRTLDEIIEIMVDTICGKRDFIRVSGADYPIAIVRERLLKLDSSHIRYILDCLKENTAKIHNIKAYLLPALYNAPSTIDAYYTNLVKYDMANDY